MIDTLQMQLALRAHALTLSVCTTGSATLGASASGFTRSAGSFLADGFYPGMEVEASGFASNDGTHVIEEVSATLLSVTGLDVESESAGRTISVGLPSQRSWENDDFDPPTGSPWVDEQFIPGPTRQVSSGPNAHMEARPMYQLTVHALEDKDVGAPRSYGTALLQHFRPTTSIALSNGDFLRVRTDTGPFEGQLIRRRAGFASVPVTFPLRLYTLNTAA